MKNSGNQLSEVALIIVEKLLRVVKDDKELFLKSLKVVSHHCQ